MRPQGFIIELFVAAMVLPIVSAGFFFFGGALLAGGLFLVPFFFAVGAVVWTLSVLAVALPVLIAISGLATFAAWGFLNSADGKKMKAQLEGFRAAVLKTSASGQPRIVNVTAEEVVIDKEVERDYEQLDEELSDFDKRLRSRRF